jgi:hypothetical protein
MVIHTSWENTDKNRSLQMEKAMARLLQLLAGYLSGG